MACPYAGGACSGSYVCATRVLLGSAGEVNSWEEIPNFEGGSLRGVRAVDGVVLDVGGVEFADGSRGGMGGISGTHDLAQPRYDAFAFQDHHQRSSRTHKRGQTLEKRLTAMHRIKSFGFILGKIHQARCDYLEVICFENLEDVARVSRRHSVGLYNGKGTFYSHVPPSESKTVNSEL